MKHQKFMGFKQLDSLGLGTHNFLYRGDLVTEGVSIVVNDVYPELANTIATSVGIELHDGLQVYKTISVVILGKEYRQGCCVVLSYEDELPKFALLETVLIVNDEKIFIVEGMEIINFDVHIMSYVLECTGQCSAVQYSQLFSKWPLSVHDHEGRSV